jgi:5-deoxy-D-glucuronate isomerase
MQHHYRPNLEKLHRHDIRPENAGWKYLSFAIAAVTH